MAGDAPGWGKVDEKTGEQDQVYGPVCWKCSGTGKILKKDKKKTKQVNSEEKLQPQGETILKISCTVAEKICPVCAGCGRIPKKRKNKDRLTITAKRAKKKNTKSYPPNYKVPGTKPVAMEAKIPGEEICSLVGHWRIFQQIGGHRWSTDDLVTAWFAGKIVDSHKLRPRQYLDLGCGIGSVLLMTAWKFPHMSCLGIEAQKLSSDMAKRNIRYNIGTSKRVEVLHGDIRNQVLPEKFDLITGTPPYFKVAYEKSNEGGTDITAKPAYGALPSCEQSAPARFEFRGGIEEYCKAAKSHLKADGVFIVCEGLGPQINASRVTNGAKAANLEIIDSIMVHGRDDKPPLFGVYAMCHSENSHFKRCSKPSSLIVRFKGGERTEEYKELLLDMGIPP
mmetsp:Transcript_20063/g.26055  ORF Transcript_20063/g.26055 Transcript_20063/m.26055 type:complete len:393 (+) Transcript_20063:3-1181(+)